MDPPNKILVSRQFLERIKSFVKEFVWSRDDYKLLDELNSYLENGVPGCDCHKQGVIEMSESDDNVVVTIKVKKEYVKALMATADEFFSLRDFHDDTEFSEQHGLSQEDGKRFLEILEGFSEGIMNCLERDFPREYEQYMKEISGSF